MFSHQNRHWGLSNQYFWIVVVQENDAYDKLTMKLCTSDVGGCLGARGALVMLQPRDRRTQTARQRSHIRLHTRVDRLEDTISHFYDVINELRERVSTLEKKLNPLAKHDRTDRIPNPNEKPESCYCSALPKGSGLCLPCYKRWLAGRRS